MLILMLLIFRDILLLRLCLGWLLLQQLLHLYDFLPVHLATLHLFSAERSVGLLMPRVLRTTGTLKSVLLIVSISRPLDIFQIRLSAC